MATFKLNSALASYLREHIGDDPDSAESCSEPEISDGRPPSYVAQRWRLDDRLSAEQIRELIDSFLDGTPKHVLAKRYGIGLTSVKKLLRRHNARRGDT